MKEVVLGEREGKKRGPKPKNQTGIGEVNKPQTKFFVDLSEDSENLNLVQDILNRANSKDYGKAVTFKDLAIFTLTKITDKELEKIQENSLSDMEKVQRARDEFNRKNNLNLSLGEYLVKKLSIS